MNYRKIFCYAALAVFTFSSALCMKNVHASDTQAGSQSAPKTSAASANMIPVLNYVPADADTVAFFNIKNFMNAESQNSNTLKNGISNQIMKSNDVSSYDLDGEIAVFSQSALNQDGGVILKIVFNSKGIESEKLLKVCEEFLFDFFNGKVEKGQIRNSKNYLLSSGKDCNVLIVASEPYQIQITYSSKKPVTPGVFSITRNPSGLVEELKAVKDKHQFIVKGNLNNNLRTIGKLIPHGPQAKYIRAISDYSLNFSEKDNNLQLEASLNFMLEKYCTDVHKKLEAIKSLLPADKKITLTSEIKDKTGLNVSVSTPLADLQTSLSELEKYLNMSADDLDKLLKEKEKKEKREQAMKAKKAREASQSSSNNAGPRRPAGLPSHLD